jgi:hypothetical protein
MYLHVRLYMETAHLVVAFWNRAAPDRGKESQVCAGTMLLQTFTSTAKVPSMKKMTSHIRPQSNSKVFEESQLKLENWTPY